MTTVTCYTDGACGQYCAGIGWVIEGDISEQGRRTIDDDITSMEAELHALLEAVRIAAVRSEWCETITIHTDCKPLVRKLSGDERRSDDWVTYCESAHWLLDKFDEWEVRYSDRERVAEAHDLAREALHAGREA